MTQAQRIIFAGSSDFAVTQLDAMLTAGLPVVGVLSKPDRPAGRGRHPQPTPVTARARESGLPVATPSSLRHGAGQEFLSALAPDLLVVVAYGLILTPDILQLPALGCLNVHASLLPRWRGAAPVEHALLAGDDETGVCIMEMEAGLDTGPIRLSQSTQIRAGETGGELEHRLAQLGAPLLLSVLKDLSAHPARPQATTGITHARRLTRSDAVLDLTAPADVVARRIQALNPRMPVTLTTPDGTRLCLRRAQALAGPTGAHPGTVLQIDHNGLTLAVGTASVCITELQIVGGKGTLLSGKNLSNALHQRLAPGAQLASPSCAHNASHY